MWHTLLFGGIAAIFLAMTAASLFHLRWVRRLPSLGEVKPVLENPSSLCSVVLPARDEETRIETTIPRLLARAGGPLEVIVVDERSHDGGGEILRRLATEGAGATG